MKHWRKLFNQWDLRQKRRRSTSRESRASTRPKAVSLEKIDQTGSIKINKSSVDKMTRYAVENKLVSRQGRRSGSRDKGESSSWTDSEDDIEKKRRGDSCHWGEKGFNCQSKKYSNNSAQARKVDTI